MLILAIDSCAAQASVCISDDNNVLGEFYMNTKQKHSQTLMSMTEKLLECTKVTLDKINLFAVTNGPGSFTGVRIGVSCIKGMALPFNTPCIGVSSLESLAYGALNSEKLICPVMDARCGQVYNALFRINNGIPVRITDDRVITIEDLSKELEGYSEKILLTGDGADVCAESDSFKALIQNGCEAFISYNHASYAAKAAFEIYKSGDIKSPKALSPVYISMPQAQREHLKKTEELK